MEQIESVCGNVSHALSDRLELMPAPGPEVLPPLTVERLIEVVLSDARRTKNWRKCTASKLRAFARVLGAPPAALRADTPTLRRSIAKANPGGAGIKSDYWKQIVSAVWQAMSYAGQQVLPGMPCDLPAPWQQLFNLVPARPHRLALTALVRTAVSLGLNPSDLDQSAMRCLRDAMRQSYRRSHYARAFRRGLRMWEICQKEWPDVWPQHPISIEFDNDGYTLTWAAFPELERDTDRMLCEQSMQRSRRHAMKKPVRPSVARQRKYSVLRAASILVLQSQCPAESIRSLLQIATPDVVEMVIDFVLARGRPEHSGDLANLCWHLNEVARYVGAAPDVLTDLRNIRKTVLRPRGAADKNRRLLLLFRDPGVRRRFLDAPGKVIKRLQTKATLTANERAYGQLAVGATFLTYAPLRVSELMSLCWGVHVLDRGGGKARKVSVHLEADETKNEQARDFYLSEAVVKVLDIQTKAFRGKIPVNSAYVFPSIAGGRRDPQSFSQGLARLLSRETGVRMTAHQFRHVVGYIYLRENKGCYETVRKFLGHRSIRTTIEYYAFMLEDDAFELLDSTIS